MDFNNNGKNTQKRKAQSIQEMINSTPSGAGIRKSGYSGPRNAVSSSTGHTTDLSGITVTRSLDHDRWGNSNEGMPKPKKARYKADVANPMRGNVLRREQEQSRERLNQKARNIQRDRRERRRDDLDEDRAPVQHKRQEQYVAPQYKGPFDSWGWIVYSGILFLCVIVTLIVSGVKPRGSGYVYPMHIITISGVVNSSYEHLMGVGGTFGGSSSYTASNSSDGTGTPNEAGMTNPDGTKVVEKPNAGDLTDLGAEGEAATLDDGSGNIPGITPVSSHEELVTQIQQALSAGNTDFIAAKFSYQDENTGALNGYPISQIKHFCQYMQENPGKIDSFINDVKSEDFSAMNGTAYVLKLPIMKFTVIMGESQETFVLDNTVVSVSGFSDVIVNGNQSAAIYPLLPCMYTVTLTNNAWGNSPSQSQEIEATLGEGNLDIKVGKRNE